MKRFSVSFTEEEYEQLENMLDWYKDHMGLKLSRCALIKQLLFAEFKSVRANVLI